MKKLKVVKLKELGTIVGGGTPSTIVEEYYNGDISWITPKDLSGCNSKYISKGERSITQLGLDKSNAVLLPPKTILISSRAPIGYVAISTKELSTNQGFKSVIPNKNVVNTEYLYYLLRLNSDRLKNIGTGTTFKEVSKKVVEDFEMRIIEDVNEQEKIANLLSALDNKIELNNQMNKDLEELAQTLYTKWFINFDFPNEEGKPYKSSGGEMIDSELGEIPAGWRIGKLGDLIKVSTGKKDANYGTKDGKYNFYTCSKEPIKAPDYSFDTKAILLAGNGEFWLRWFEGKFEAYQRTYVIETNNSYEFEYVFFNLKKNLSKITQLSTGSIIKYLKLGMIVNSKLIIPPKDIIEWYHKQVESILDKTNLLEQENQQLKETRDLLLPYLMSGKIDLGA